MGNNGKIETNPIRVTRFAAIIMVFWSAFILGSYLWSVVHIKEGTLEMARLQARDSFAKDITYRRWNASHGGVYVPITESTQPNPYLVVHEREISTPSGIQLTKINPAFMTRQVHELTAKTYGIQGHITSLNPIRPANKPDPWETKALKAFHKGTDEYSSVEMIDNQEYMRLMRPLITEQGCLKCHAVQGYQLGEIRGGISMSVPMAPLWAVSNPRIRDVSIWHGLLLISGWLGISFGASRLNRQIEKRQMAEDEVVLTSQEWKRTFDTVPDLVMILDVNHRVKRLNKPMADRLGLSPEDVVGMACHECIHETEEPPEYYPHSQLIADKQEHSVEITAQRLGGDFLISVTPFHDAKGNLVGSVHVARDITEKKRAEERRHRLNELNENLIIAGDLKNRLDQITSSMVDIFDADFARIWINRTGDLCDFGCIHAVTHEGSYVCTNRDKCLHLISSSGRYTRTTGTHGRVPFGAYKIGRIASGEDSYFLTNDVRNDSRIHDKAWAEQLGLKSFAGFKLTSEQGEPIGVLALFSKHTISSDASAVLQGLANTTSHVIQNALKEEDLKAERDKLQQALSKIKIMSGLLPICATCKKIRDDTGYWNHIESYVRDHSDADFSHSICPDCANELYPELEIYDGDGNINEE